MQRPSWQTMRSTCGRVGVSVSRGCRGYTETLAMPATDHSLHCSLNSVPVPARKYACCSK